MTAHVWTELESKGFVVVRDVLSAEDCAALLADFDGGAPPTSYPHGFKLVGRAALARGWGRIEPLVAEIKTATSIAVDAVNFLTLSHYITTSLVERTSYLHQDFDLDYKLTSDHIHYLNFWIPIAKPDPARSNVCVVPFDALRARSEAAYARLYGSGGHRLIPKHGTTEIWGNYGGLIDDGARTPELVLDFDIEELVETPAIGAGDALVMRGDLIHRTQDAATPRVAASIRATSSHKTIHKDRVPAPVPGSTDPATGIHTMIHRCFAALDRDEVTIGQLVAFSRGSAP
jgi:hypothetical protein